MSFVARKRIVIVDDSRTVQAMLENAFDSREEFRVVAVANDAASAMSLIENLKPEIVTIDLCMPEVDGEALVGMLAQARGVCKIVISDSVGKDAALSARLKTLGASGCISKQMLAQNRTLFFHNVLAAFDKFNAEREARPSAAPSKPHVPTKAAPSVEHRTSAKPRIAHFGIPAPLDEERRLHLLEEKQLANLLPDRQLDLATKILATTTSFPICLVTFIDGQTQWIKSAYGLARSSGPREHAFCSYTIAQENPFIVADAPRDARFRDHPEVLGGIKVGTYAGHPILAEDGTRIGAICLIEQNVKPITAEAIEALTMMADLVGEIIKARPAFVSVIDPAPTRSVAL
jgi:DNA-binding NarL/FixJ family response regulator